MDLERNKKTFNYLFNLFLEMGEEKLGRQLSPKELYSLKSSIARRCKTIDKKDIVKEIYKLELAKNEKKLGHLGIRQKLALKSLVSNRTNCPVSFKSSSNELTNAVSYCFSNAHFSDKYKNIIFTSPEIAKDEQLKLKNSYKTDAFRYKAPLGTIDKLKRLAILGIAGLTLVSPAIVLNQNSSTIVEPTQIVDSYDKQNLSSTQSNTTINLEDTVSDNLLYDFKTRYADEYNLSHGTSHVSAHKLKIREIYHNYVYQIKQTDSSGNESYTYITHGNYPAETEQYLDEHGYEYSKFTNYPGISVVSATNSDQTRLYDTYAIINGKCVPIADGDSPETLKTINSSPNVLLEMHKCFSEITRNPSRKSYYIDYLKDYYSSHPENALNDNITFQLDEPALEL